MDFTPHTDLEVAEMLRVIGVSSIEELFCGIPEAFKVQGALKLPDPLTEPEVLAHLRDLAGRNRPAPSFLGAGAYDHYVPSVVHHLTGRGEFLTAYTPYQPELSQGTLQAQFEYQTMVASLLGMDVSNASMYEGATALAEACLMAQRHTRRARVLVARTVHPEYRDVLRTYIAPADVVEVPYDATGAIDFAALATMLDGTVAAIAAQTPNFLGVIEDFARISEMAHAAGALSIATFSEPLAFGLIEAPGNLGADIAAGEGQALGLPLSFGGPYVGMFAVKQPFVKGMPGRIIGRTVDSKGTPCYTLTLAAREQHIRRERASSNICSNEGLCALAVAIHLSMLGRTGLQKLARYNHHRAERLKGMLAAAGLPVAFTGPTFNEFVVKLGRPAGAVADALAAKGLVAGLPLDRTDLGVADGLLVAVTENRTDADMARLVDALRG
jgi:glycine dehydrogenase subunit 1